MLQRGIIKERGTLCVRGLPRVGGPTCGGNIEQTEYYSHRHNESAEGKKTKTWRIQIRRNKGRTLETRQSGIFEQVSVFLMLFKDH